MPTLERRTSQTFQRLRKLSDTIRNAVVPKPDKLEPRRRPSYRGGQRVAKEDIRLAGPSHQQDRWEQMVADSIPSPTRNKPGPQRPPRPSLDGRPTLLQKTRRISPEEPIYRSVDASLAMRTRGEAQWVFDNQKSLFKPPQPVNTRPQAGASAVPFPSTSKVSTTTSSRIREKPVPVPKPDLKMFSPFRPLPQTPVQDNPRSSSTPPTNPRSPYTYRALPVPPSSSSLAKARESVYFSTSAATVRRQGAIRRTSSTGEAGIPQLVMAMSPRRERSDESAANHHYHTAHGSGYQTRTLPTRRPEGPVRHRAPTLPPLQVRPQPRDVPRDVSSELDYELGSAVTPRSAKMYIPPPPPATIPIAEKMQAKVRVHETVAAQRAVAVSGAVLHHAVSQKALVVQPRAEGPKREREGRRTKRAQTVEVFGIEIYEKDRLQALCDEKVARRSPGPATQDVVAGTDAGTRPLIVRKGKGKEVAS